MLIRIQTLTRRSSVRSGAASGQVRVAGTFDFCSTRLLPKALLVPFVGARARRGRRFEASTAKLHADNTRDEEGRWPREQ